MGMCVVCVCLRCNREVLSFLSLKIQFKGKDVYDLQTYRCPYTCLRYMLGTHVVYLKNRNTPGATALCWCCCTTLSFGVCALHTLQMYVDELALYDKDYMHNTHDSRFRMVQKQICYYVWIQNHLMLLLLPDIIISIYAYCMYNICGSFLVNCSVVHMKC